jgi:hypothetical protein
MFYIYDDITFIVYELFGFVDTNLQQKKEVAVRPYK